MEKLNTSVSSSNKVTSIGKEIDDKRSNVSKLTMAALISLPVLVGCGDRAREDIQKATGSIGSGVARVLDFAIIDTPSAAVDVGSKGVTAGYHLGKAGVYSVIDGTSNVYEAGKGTFNYIVGDDSSESGQQGRY